MQNILSDIMGTITPNSFTKILLEDFRCNAALNITNSNDADINQIMESIKRENGLETDEEVIGYVHGQICKRNFKPDYLKLLGFVNIDSYRTGKVKGEFYGDVFESFQRWNLNKSGVYIFSNGSEESQEELFKTMKDGEKNDLSFFVSRFFDTAQVGSKSNPDSYKQIAEIIRAAPSTFLFLSDLEAELEAADKAGYGNVFLVVRPSNKPTEYNRYRRISSFNEID